MLKINRFSLENGLRVVVHEDKSTPIIAVNLLYGVGSRDESIRRTGIAHLLEHLMFSGSKNAPKFDIPVDQAGGENNAFTNSDFTNYYITLPKNNLEVALWLESDRMANLNLTNESLEIQRKVVIEEFKQNYLNQPYGDAYLNLKPLAYKKHPYRWATIGRDTSQIEKVSNNYIKNFYRKYYSPSNAILTIAGDIKPALVNEYVEHWFGTIKGKGKITKLYPKEPKQLQKRTQKIITDVPQDAVWIAWHMGNRLDDEYYNCDLISDILSSGKSSRLYKKFVKELKLFSEVNAYITGDIDDGLFIITGKLNQKTNHNDAIKYIEDEVNLLKSLSITDEELNKVKNKIEANFIYSQSSILSKAMNLGYYEYLGDANLINQETSRYNAVSALSIKKTAKNIFCSEKMNVLTYQRPQS